MSPPVKGRRPAPANASCPRTARFRTAVISAKSKSTGVVEILGYTIEDDVGNVINPLILEGQIVGDVAQGLGQAYGEHAHYDRDSGQRLTATFMDYTMPRADWVPAIDFRYREVPSPGNPLGVKGAGEAGTVGSAPALVNAVLDVLSVRGIEHVDMPLTPLKLWSLLHARSYVPGQSRSFAREISRKRLGPSDLAD